MPRGARAARRRRLLASDGRVVAVRRRRRALLHVDVRGRGAAGARGVSSRQSPRRGRAARRRAARRRATRVLERLLRGLGLEPVRVEAPFEPEGGAYGQAHAHVGDAGRLAARRSTSTAARDARRSPVCCSSASRALPIGAFSYSQGLEAAVDDGGSRRDERRRWLGTSSSSASPRWDATLDGGAGARAPARGLSGRRSNSTALPRGRETARAAGRDRAAGQSLLELLRDGAELPPDIAAAARGARRREARLPAAGAAAAAGRGIEVGDALFAFLWSWLENSVLAAAQGRAARPARPASGC